MMRKLPILLISLLLAGCNSGGDEAPTKPVAQKRIPKVVVATVATQSFEPTTVLPGVVEANDDILVASEAQGVITQRPVKKGERVERNQPLVFLDDEILKTKVTSAREQAKYLESLLKKQKKLLAEELVSRDVYEATQAQHLAAKEALKAAEAQHAKTTISAPISGVVASLPLDVGEFVRTGATVTNIVNIDIVKVLVRIPETDVRDIHKGDFVTVISKRFHGKEYRLNGIVSFVNPKGDPASKTYLAEIKVANAERLLLPEMVVDVRFTKENIQDAILIPSDVILMEGEKCFVYVVDNGRAAKKIVEKLRLAGERVIVSGLNPEDKLIVQGHHLVVDQGAVQAEEI